MRTLSRLLSRRLPNQPPQRPQLPPKHRHTRRTALRRSLEGCCCAPQRARSALNVTLWSLQLAVRACGSELADAAAHRGPWAPMQCLRKTTAREATSTAVTHCCAPKAGKQKQAPRGGVPRRDRCSRAAYSRLWRLKGASRVPWTRVGARRGALQAQRRARVCWCTCAFGRSFSTAAARAPSLRPEHPPAATDDPPSYLVSIGRRAAAAYAACADACPVLMCGYDLHVQRLTARSLPARARAGWLPGTHTTMALKHTPPVRRPPRPRQRRSRPQPSSAS